MEKETDDSMLEKAEGRLTAAVSAIEESIQALKDENRDLRGEIQRLKTIIREAGRKIEVIINQTEQILEEQE